MANHRILSGDSPSFRHPPDGGAIKEHHTVGIID